MGTPIHSAQDVRAWVENTQDDTHFVPVTFVINTQGTLLIADRHSEHVVCAGGLPVLAAGEIFFELSDSVEVVEITNQSIGYCPEPQSWEAVQKTLSQIGIVFPDVFFRVCEFRRCLKCETINLIKDGLFECIVCRSELPLLYNLQ